MAMSAATAFAHNLRLEFRGCECRMDRRPRPILDLLCADPLFALHLPHCLLQLLTAGALTKTCKYCAMIGMMRIDPHMRLVRGCSRGRMEKLMRAAARKPRLES